MPAASRTNTTRPQTDRQTCRQTADYPQPAHRGRGRCEPRAGAAQTHAKGEEVGLPLQSSWHRQAGHQVCTRCKSPEHASASCSCSLHRNPPFLPQTGICYGAAATVHPRSSCTSSLRRQSKAIGAGGRRAALPTSARLLLCPTCSTLHPTVQCPGLGAQDSGCWLPPTAARGTIAVRWEGMRPPRHPRRCSDGPDSRHFPSRGHVRHPSAPESRQGPWL